MYHTSVTLTLLSRCEKVHRVSKLSCESEAVTQGMNLYVCDFDISNSDTNHCDSQSSLFFESFIIRYQSSLI